MLRVGIVLCHVQDLWVGSQPQSSGLSLPGESEPSLASLVLAQSLLNNTAEVASTNMGQLIQVTGLCVTQLALSEFQGAWEWPWLNIRITLQKAHKNCQCQGSPNQRGQNLWR